MFANIRLYVTSQRHDIMLTLITIQCDSLCANCRFLKTGLVDHIDVLQTIIICMLKNVENWCKTFQEKALFLFPKIILIQFKFIFKNVTYVHFEILWKSVFFKVKVDFNGECQDDVFKHVFMYTINKKIHF